MIVDITSKPETLRTARAQSELSLPDEAATCIRDNRVSKGDVATAARLAGIMAVKRTWELLPHCHPLSLEQCEVLVELRGNDLHIEVEVACIGSTGVEMEAMTGASIAALTAYDMLKPHCNAFDLVLGETRLLEKTGGKTDFPRRLRRAQSALVLVVHDPNRMRDELLERANHLVTELEIAGFEDIRCEHLLAQTEEIYAHLNSSTEKLLITMGSSGHRQSDCVPEVCEGLIVRSLPGLIDAARQHGLKRSPFAALSRGVAGFTEKDQLLINLPSTEDGWHQAWSALRTPVLQILNRGR